MPDNIDAPLWRYITYEKLTSLPTKRALYFSRSDLFTDTQEGTFSKETLKRRPIFFEGATDHWINVTMPLFDKRTKKCVYINCWHNNKNESKHMWMTYSESGKGIAIKSSLVRLKNAILDDKKEFLIRPVWYIDYEKEHISEANAFYPYFYKHISFQNEREFRIAVIENFEKIGAPNFDKLKFEPGLFIKVNIDILIENIYLSPFVSEVFTMKVFKLLEDYRITNKLQRSNL
ncbi:DUF2971 domain-containing protein [Patescibacteria group bacterium]|nr:DUF2971 domain-containing protein [Patescibacteria group bacterium]MBU4098272.1 DUF2971 domain-containing protein [Patescibacteria group bacterium]